MTGVSAVTAKITPDFLERPPLAALLKNNPVSLRLVSAVGNPVDALGGQIVKARLEVIAAMRTLMGTPHFRTSQELGSSMSWFAHSFPLFETKIVEGAISLSIASNAAGQSISRFMEISAADVARLMVIHAKPSADASQSDCAPTRYSAGGFLQTAVMTQSCESLRLGHSTELFLARLGRHTRRNVRLSQRIAGQSGVDFLYQSNPPPAASNPAIGRLAKGNKPLPLTAKRLAAYERLIEGKKSRFESRLTLGHGQAVSYCRGYIQGNIAHLIYQANDPIVPRINLSLLHRFKLMEHLIAQGVTDCIFPFGCAGLLKNICEPVTLEERLIIRVSLKGIMTALILAVCLPKTQMSRMILHTLCGAAPFRIIGQCSRYILSKLTAFTAVVKSNLKSAFFVPLSGWFAKDWP